MMHTSSQIKGGGGSIVNTIATPVWTPFLPFGYWSHQWTREPSWPFFLTTVRIDLVDAYKHRKPIKKNVRHSTM